jgi:hypothetical protein
MATANTNIRICEELHNTKRGKIILPSCVWEEILDLNHHSIEALQYVRDLLASGCTPVAGAHERL